jgi:hypothetical protein
MNVSYMVFLNYREKHHGSKEEKRWKQEEVKINQGR